MFARIATRIAFALAVVAASAAAANATTLVREGLDKLTRGNEQALLGKVVALHSYWNADHNFIYTDVQVRPSQSLKGKVTASDDVTFTLMGGTVGETTVLIVGGPELVPGSEYVLFLSHSDLAGGRKAALTLSSLMQGVFDVVEKNGVRRAVSQAWDHPLVPDDSGEGVAPGGEDGLELDTMLAQVRQLAGER